MNYSNHEYLLSLFWKAADKNAEYAQYLYERVKDRLDSGRSMDCDEYREMLRIAV